MKKPATGKPVAYNSGLPSSTYGLPQGKVWLLGFPGRTPRSFGWPSLWHLRADKYLDPYIPALGPRSVARLMSTSLGQLREIGSVPVRTQVLFVTCEEKSLTINASCRGLCRSW